MTATRTARLSATALTATGIAAVALGLASGDAIELVVLGVLCAVLGAVSIVALRPAAVAARHRAAQRRVARDAVGADPAAWEPAPAWREVDGWAVFEDGSRVRLAQWHPAAYQRRVGGSPSPTPGGGPSSSEAAVSVLPWLML